MPLEEQKDANNHLTSQLRLSPTRHNHIFLDGDNFLWQGTFAMYGRMYGELLALMAGRRGDSVLEKAGHELFLQTLHLSDRDRFTVWSNAVRERGLTCNFGQDEFVAEICQYFKANFRHELVPAEGANELLDLLSSFRGQRFSISVHLLSLNMEFVLPLIVDQFGWRKHFNGELLGAPFLSTATRKTKAEQASARLGADTGLVIVAGDSKGDVAAGNTLASKGFSVLTLAAATGTHTLAELRSENAAVVVESLRDLVPIVRQLI